MLGQLNAAEAFETFLQTKYVGQKRFGLEGASPSLRSSTDPCSPSTDHGLDEVADRHDRTAAGSTCWPT